MTNHVQATPAQMTVLKALDEAGKSMPLEAIAKATGRTIASVRGLVNRLDDHGMVSHRGQNVRIIRAGKVSLLANESADEIEKMLKGMKVKDIDAMSQNSLVQMSAVMLKAKKLPAKAVQQLSKAVTKHGGKIAGTEVKIDAHPTRVGSLFDQAKDGKVKLPEKPVMLTEALVIVNISERHYGSFATGRIFLNSVHPMKGTEQILKYNVAVNFFDKALKNILALLKKNGDMYQKALWINGRTNLIKGFGKSGNPTIHCYDFIEVDADEKTLSSWMI